MSAEPSHNDIIFIPIINQAVPRQTFHLIHASAFIIFAAYALYTIQQHTQDLQRLRYSQGNGGGGGRNGYGQRQF